MKLKFNDFSKVEDINQLMDAFVDNSMYFNYKINNLYARLFILQSGILLYGTYKLINHLVDNSYDMKEEKNNKKDK